MPCPVYVGKNRLAQYVRLNDDYISMKYEHIFLAMITRANEFLSTLM